MFQKEKTTGVMCSLAQMPHGAFEEFEKKMESCSKHISGLALILLKILFPVFGHHFQILALK